MQYEWPLIGGIIIGLATSLFLVLNGRLIGISGIIGTLLSTAWSDRYWRLLFLIGLMLGGYLTVKIFPQFSFEEIPGSNTEIFLGALLVGFGTRLGGGCTSGHGVCGISRFSKRSIVATCLFIIFAMLTVFSKKWWSA